MESGCLFNILNALAAGCLITRQSAATVSGMLVPRIKRYKTQLNYRKSPKRVWFRYQNSPSGKPSPPCPSPWGGASAMCTQIFVAFSRQFSLSRACQASATASGPSPPPEAEAASSQVFISFTDDVKSWTRVTKLESWGGWSRYSMRARWMSDFSLATISSTILRMFCGEREGLVKTMAEDS